MRHINRLLGSDFAPRQWRHVARYCERLGGIQMHLQARETIEVQWPGGRRRFEAGERIHTEDSYKYTVAGFESLLSDAGFRNVRHWTDERAWFAVFWAQS